MNFIEAEKLFPWVKGGTGNVVHEMIDRHVESGLGEKTALYYGDDVRKETLSFADIQRQSSCFARGLRELGIVRGDRVFLFMPRLPELYIALVGIIRMGAIACPLFEAFMDAAVRDRLLDSQAKAIVTTPAMLSRIPLQDLPDLTHVIVVGANREEATRPPCVRYEEVMKQSEEPWIERVDADSGLLLHYTAGSSRKPKGVLHAHRALVQQYKTGALIYEFQPNDVYWNTADPGWIAGTFAGLLAPWLHGVSVVIWGGRFRPENWYQTLESYGVSVWSSSPTAFRMILTAGAKLPRRYQLGKLRKLVSTGEPLSLEVRSWAERTFDAVILENWGLTETGGAVCAQLSGSQVRPGSLGQPMPGLELAIVDEEGRELPAHVLGVLAIRAGWMGMMKGIWGDETVFAASLRDGWYLSGNAAFRDEAGYYWLEGQIAQSGT